MIRAFVALSLIVALAAPAEAGRRRTCVTVHMDGVGAALVCAPPHGR